MRTQKLPSQTENTMHPHALSIEKVIASLQANLTQGLAASQVEASQAQYGRNVLPEPKRITRLQLFFKQLNSFLILILCAAAILSAVLGDYSDAAIILLAIVINVIVGYIQEGKAQKALEALRHVISAQATVLREGREQLIDVAELVPGDVLLIAAGDKIPADARIYESTQLEMNEAVLTGESIGVDKGIDVLSEQVTLADRSNMVFTGTTVMRGSARALIVRTGIDTEIGKIAALLHSTPEEITPLQRRLNQLARVIGVVVIGISLVVFGIGMLSDLPLVEVLTTAVAIAVSAIPEGLAVSVTVILAIGMKRILQRNALVRNLQAAETLGSTSVICTDKTGTLTEGKMQVVSVMTRDYHFQDIHSVERHDDKGLEELLFALSIGMQCNDAHVVTTEGATQEKIIVGNMTEQALLAAALGVGLDKLTLEEREPRLATLPFDSTQKMMATLHGHPKIGQRIYLKGAPERILALSSHIRIGDTESLFSSEEREAFEVRYQQESAKGLRILAVAYINRPQATAQESAANNKITEEDLHDAVLVGLLCVQDPLRPHIQDVFEKTKTAGIRTIMITGDHPITAKAIAQACGMQIADHQILEGEALQKMSEQELYDRVEDIHVYARVSPQDKLNIIRAWQAKGHVVAMTGDGVNDAPALKAANIGIALGSGTDVAKEAADIVLLDNQFSTIVAAVEEGRGIFDNLRKVVLYLLGDSFSEVIVVTGALLIGMPLPLAAVQILWINLVSDGLPNIALTVDPKDPRNMLKKPRAEAEPVVSRSLLWMVILISLFTGALNLGLFWWILETTNNLNLASTVVFMNLALDSLVYVFSVRSLDVPVWKSALFSNPWLLLSVVFAFFIQCITLYIPFLQDLLGTVPLEPQYWVIIALTCMVVLAVFELLKKFFLHSTIKSAI